MFILDLSGLTLQAGPRNIVKDEYTPGGSIVGQANLEMDGNEIGTIQHHPIHIAGLGYSSMAAMHQQPGSGESNRLDLFFILVLFCFCFDLKGDSKPGIYQPPPRVVPKVEPNTNDVQSRNIWGQPSSSVPPQQQQQQQLQQQRISHPPPHCKGFYFIISLFIILWNERVIKSD